MTSQRAGKRPGYQPGDLSDDEDTVSGDDDFQAQAHRYGNPTQKRKKLCRGKEELEAECSASSIDAGAGPSWAGAAGPSWSDNDDYAEFKVQEWVHEASHRSTSSESRSFKSSSWTSFSSSGRSSSGRSSTSWTASTE
ncbi:uncharacterized protein LOC119390196 [Rhipicephalus sanguineus]|uniref:uncharacterized protein LOC119390196 n=1 Tax=Rhipicephalus sanguineus TaxID=34632 RepID=UPI001894438E|nr:uncharacterized protein LOC119390196 [Rhipicephalus sanguineus]